MIIKENEKEFRKFLSKVTLNTQDQYLRHLIHICEAIGERKFSKNTWNEYEFNDSLSDLQKIRNLDNKTISNCQSALNHWKNFLDRKLPNYWIFVIGGVSPHSAKEIYKDRMDLKLWGFNDKARNRQNIKSGDNVVFYSKAKDCEFLGTAKLRSSHISYTDKTKEEISHRQIPSFSNNGVEIEPLDQWDKPRSIRGLVHKLHFIKNKDEFGSFLQGSIIEINESDYNKIVGLEDIELRKELSEIKDDNLLIKERKKVLREIQQREGQPAFRKKMLEIYEGRCAITGYMTEQVLEAAHIVPYSEIANNDPTNGILLRADIHTLFDKDLIRISEIDYTIEIDETIKETKYAQYAGHKLTLPKSSLPSKYALKIKRESYESVGKNNA